jgi:hypothetical protein
MSLIRGPRIVTQNLIFALDAGDSNCYPGSGTTLIDITGRGNNCTLVNGPTVDYQGFTLDGTNDYAYISHGGSLSFSSGNYTICAWNKNITSAAGLYGGIITNDNLGDNAWKFYKDNVKTCYSARSGTSIADFPSFTTGRWHFYAFTFTAGTGQLYFDGVAGNSFSGASNPTSYNNIAFGSYRYNDAVSGTYLNNQTIGPVHLYDRSLSSSEIVQNFNSMRGRFRV